VIRVSDSTRDNESHSGHDELLESQVRVIFTKSPNVY